MPFLQLMYELQPEAEVDTDDSDLDDLDDLDLDETDDEIEDETEYWPGPSDERFTAELGLSEDDRDAPEDWTGWTGEVGPTGDREAGRLPRMAGWEARKYGEEEFPPEAEVARNEDRAARSRTRARDHHRRACGNRCPESHGYSGRTRCGNGHALRIVSAAAAGPDASRT